MENSQRLDKLKPRMPYKAEKLGVMVGMLLGDASIVKKYPNNIVICHTNKVRDYFDWKCRVLSSLGYRKNKTRQMHPIVKGKEYSASIVDFVGDDINWFYRQSYNQDTGKRKVNYLLARHLNQYGLAIWFMDDGNNCQQKKMKNISYCLNTQAYGEDEQKMLIKILKKRFDLNPVIHKDKKYFKLYFGAKDKNGLKLQNLISPYIHPSMEYKLRWTPKV